MSGELVTDHPEPDRMDTSTPTPQTSNIFQFDGDLYQFGQLPKTPEPGEQQTSTLQPPDAPRAPPKFRLRRRRTNPPNADQIHLKVPPQDIPLPTIELLHTPESIEKPTPVEVDSSLLSPIGAVERAISPPKTPVAQIRSSFNGDLEDRAYETNLERPSSSLSVFSDSSVSSFGSSDTYGDSCTSPESDTTDPFVFPDTTSKPHGLASPLKVQTSKPKKRARTSSLQIKWTPEMDDHLWKAYLAYQTHPEFTPFKALPGVPPPLGVCHRVARQAKRSWKDVRHGSPQITDHTELEQATSIDARIREASAPPDFNFGKRPSLDRRTSDFMLRSHSSNEMSRKRPGRWPRSEASTRRRLRELCKSKPNIPPHYQRLMQTRSPSPFTSSSSTAGRRSSRLSPSPTSKSQGSSSFSTGDLQFSLKVNTISSMQPGNPLHQLSSGQASRQQPATWSSPSSSRAVHQKSQSLHNTHRPIAQNMAAPRSLASPFRQGQDDPFVTRKQSTIRASGQTAPPSSYRPPPAPTGQEEPWQIHAPRPMSGSMKRRAEYPLGEELVSDNPETRRDFLENLFRDNLTSGHRRVRSRGFSMGAMRQQPAQTSRSLGDLFSPPSAEDEGPSRMDLGQPSSMVRIGGTFGSSSNVTTANVTSSNGSSDEQASSNPHQSSGEMRLLKAPSLGVPFGGSQIPRLGSPFIPHPPAAGNSNTFPRSSFPQGLNVLLSLGQQHSPTDTKMGEASPDSIEQSGQQQG